MNQMVTQSLQRQMDQEAKQDNIVFDFEEHWNVDQEMYEMLNKGTVLEPKSLWIEELPTRHQCLQ